MWPAKSRRLPTRGKRFLREGFRIALEVRHVLRPDQLAKAAAIRQQLLGIQDEVRGLFNENQ